MQMNICDELPHEHNSKKNVCEQSSVMMTDNDAKFISNCGSNGLGRLCWRLGKKNEKLRANG